MDLPTRELVDLLTYLLPGFVSAAIFYNLTPWPLPSPFERTVQALIFTIAIQVILYLLQPMLLWLGEHVGVVGTWNAEARLVCSVLIATLLGVVVAGGSNHDLPHRVLRYVRVTSQTSFSSEWYGAFRQCRGYVVLHLMGERRLYGWPEEWPSAPDAGHFLIAQAEWLDEGKRIPLAGVERVLVAAGDVQMVEFMGTLPASKESKNG